MKKDKYKKVSWEERADQLAAIFKGHCRMSDEEFFALRLAYRRLYTTIWRGDRKDPHRLHGDVLRTECIEYENTITI